MHYTVHMFWEKIRVLQFEGVNQSSLCNRHEVKATSVKKYIFRLIPYRQNILSVCFSKHVMHASLTKHTTTAKGSVCLFINIIFSYLKSNIIVHVFVNVTTMLLWKRGNLISSRAPVLRGGFCLERIHQDPPPVCKDHKPTQAFCWEQHMALALCTCL